MGQLTFVATLVLAGCASRPAVVQSGGPTADSVRAVVVAPAKTWADTTKPLPSLSRGWNRIPGRDGTGCAHDSTFAFRVRPGLPDKVVVFLNGGGFCSRAQDCDPRGKPTFTMTADSANDASVRQGLFDVGNDANPVREFTIVFVPYCTGDLHLGTRTRDYETRDGKGGTRSFAVRHEGAANVEAVLDWLYANVRGPRVVFVAGSSMGAISSPVIAEKIARHYPRARVVQLGDAAGGYRVNTASSILASWGATDYLQRDPTYRSLDSADFTFERLYTAAGRAAPSVRYAQVNTVEDAAQLHYLGLFGSRSQSLVKPLAANLEQVRGGVPWFRTYTAPGKVHTILRSNALYAMSVDGVKFRDWLAALVNGEPVDDVGMTLLAPKAERRK